MRRPFELILILATCAVVAFLALPLVALVVRTSPGELARALTSDIAVEAMLVSLKTSAIAHAFVLVVGTPAAYLLATKEFRGRRLLVSLLDLPLVLPPAVAGIALLAAFGRLGLIGRSLSSAGIEIAFTQIAVVMAIVFVASPFYLRQAVATFERIDGRLLEASRTLGDKPGQTFRRVALPLSLQGLGAGSALAWGRGLGEFGATITFAGSVRGVTQTLPLAIYAELDRDFDVAVAIGVLLLIVSATLIVIVRSLPSWQQSSSSSTSRSATSASS